MSQFCDCCTFGKTKNGNPPSCSALAIRAGIRLPDGELKKISEAKPITARPLRAGSFVQQHRVAC
jgi:hypothetical protein